VVADPIICISRAILSPFNAFVNEFNATILHNAPGQSHHYHSSNSVEGDVENSGEMVLADPDFLNSLDEPGIPPHVLNLEVGAICRLTRNFDASRGLTKKYLSNCPQFAKRHREVETISSVAASQVVNLVCKLPHECYKQLIK
jgi:hypothetical protein